MDTVCNHTFMIYARTGVYNYAQTQSGFGVHDAACAQHTTGSDAGARGHYCVGVGRGDQLKSMRQGDIGQFKAGFAVANSQAKVAYTLVSENCQLLLATQDGRTTEHFVTAFRVEVVQVTRN